MSFFLSRWCNEHENGPTSNLVIHQGGVLQKNYTKTIDFLCFNPLAAGTFNVFWFIRGQSVTQRSMGRDPPRYPNQDPGS